MSSRLRRPQAPSAIATLCDESVPLPMRSALLARLAQDEAEDSRACVGALLAAAARGEAENLYHAKAQEMSTLVSNLKSGPLRCATFMGLLEPGAPRRARVALADGQSAFCSVPDELLAASLALGDEVLLDAQATAVLGRAPESPVLGEALRLERVLDDGRLEVRLRDESRRVVLARASLAAALRAGEVQPGASLLVCERRGLALAAVPPADGLQSFRFLQRVAVPRVDLDEHVGAPPELIAELGEHVRRELEQPGSCARWGLPRCRTWLLTGLPGTGKTLSILATWRRLYEVCARHIGVPLEALPPRVLRLRVSEVLSMWLGESDKAIDRFFDEVEQLARTPWVGPDGRRHELPVLVIGEEIDGLARSRGTDGIHDRILTTLLERLDTLRSGLHDHLVIGLFTTNVPGLVDAAFLRRAGGQETRFGFLDERGFRAVLEKLLRGRPLAAVAAQNGRATAAAGAAARAALVGELAAWVYAAPEGSGLVELHYTGTAQPEVRGYRHFMTGALLERSVNVAAAEGLARSFEGDAQAGLDADSLRLALHRQVRSLVERLDVGNAASQLDLPSGRHLARVRALPDAPPVERFHTASSQSSHPIGVPS